MISLLEVDLRFVHAADLHLDSPLVGLDRYEGAPVEEFRAATRRALENLVKLCLEEEAKLLLLAGDLYDGAWKDYNTGLFFAKQMQRLREGGVRVEIISGNHDAESEITRSLPWPDNVHVFSTRKPETRAHDDLGIAVHGQGFSTRKVTEDLAARYPEPIARMLNIGMLHTALEGREGHDTYAPTTAEALARKGYDYWALGHVHAREIVREAPWIVFPGNLQGRHARELGPKGASLVTVAKGKITSVEHRALDVVRWAACEVDVSRAKDADGALEPIALALESAAEAVEGRPVAARVLVIGQTEAHARIRGDLERFESEVRALALRVPKLWVEKVIVKTRPPREPLGSEAARSLGEELARLRNSAELTVLLATLREKLPPVARRAEIDAGALLDDAEALLLARLFEEP